MNDSKTTCSTGDGRPVKAHGLCAACYMAERRGPSVKQMEGQNLVTLKIKIPASVRAALARAADKENKTVSRFVAELLGAV